MKKRWALWLALLLVLSACAGGEPPRRTFPLRLVLEEGEGFTADRYTALCAPGDSLTFHLREAEGYRILSCDHENATLARTAEGVTLRIAPVRYSGAIRLRVERSALAFTYHNGEEALTLPVTASHLRLNTAPAGLFTRPGHTLYAWNTAPDGAGETFSLGSRVWPEQGRDLYAQWAAWTPEDRFTWDQGTVTGYTGTDDPLVIPASLGGAPVTAIAAGAFADCAAKTVILPPTLQTIAPEAFRDAALSTLWLFDSTTGLSDRSFSGCTSLTTLHLNAVSPPVYAGTWYATLADKLDRLESLAGERKLVLFSGSSTRFGYDSAKLEAGLPGYAVANLGVFAYANALPQLALIRQYLLPGDVLLLSPELDAAKRQFCTTNELDAPFFNMMEADYGRLAQLDLRQYSHSFSALAEYLASRPGQAPRSYALSPADFDEEGNPTETPSYNAYGDYILYRPDAPEDTPLYGLPVPYVAAYYSREQYLEPLNREIARFTAAGVQVFLTWSPRNRQALSSDSTPEALEELEAYFRENLDAPFLTDLDSALVPGRLLYGTDNHLSTHGVALRTESVLNALQNALFALQMD